MNDALLRHFSFPPDQVSQKIILFRREPWPLHKHRNRHIAFFPRLPLRVAHTSTLSGTRAEWKVRYELPLIVFSRRLLLSISVNDEASGRGVAQVRTHAHYHKVSVLADVLLALGAIVRSRY